MAISGRPKALLVLSDEERAQLESWARRATSAQALALRSRIVLACAQGQTNQAVAAQERVSTATVGKWRARFIASRLDGLVDEPRSGRPRTIVDAQVEDVLVRTLETTPKNATHWSPPAAVISRPSASSLFARYPSRWLFLAGPSPRSWARGERPIASSQSLLRCRAVNTPWAGSRTVRRGLPASPRPGMLAVK